MINKLKQLINSWKQKYKGKQETVHVRYKLDLSHSAYIPFHKRYLDEIRRKHHKIIICDESGVANKFDSDSVKIINPFEEKSNEWDVFKISEVKNG
jgi:Fe2+ or Zn2+ uptake regulation protein